MSEVKRTSLAAFASQLLAWRQRMGWTQVEAGDKLGYSASLVSGIETLDKTPTAEFARLCDRVFGTPGFDEESGTPGTFMTLHALVAREAWPSYFAPVIDLETRAIRVHEWEMRAVPGLLQTEEYARAVISAGRPRDSAAAVDRIVSARLSVRRSWPATTRRCCGMSCTRGCCGTWWAARRSWAGSWTS